MTKYKTPSAYFGGKQNYIKYIAPLVPLGTFDTYIEPFFGSGALFFSRARWAQTEIINDLNGTVINFFRVLRDHPRQLIRALNLTPHSRQEALRARVLELEAKTELQRAIYFFVRVNQTFSSTATGWLLPNGSGRRADEWMNKVNETNMLPAARRLLSASIENEPAEKVMKRYDHKKTFMYLDPPYLGANMRSIQKGYAGHGFTLEQMEALVAQLLTLKSKIILSGYDHECFKPLTDAGWKIKKIPVIIPVVNFAKNTKDRGRVECLWMSPNITTAQTTLF